ncbi:MAG: Hpt domain-containing protein [Lachnospiraceae bacterium]|nr:Hpt domain-containing protein [Lachnospiraceae bacterium]
MITIDKLKELGAHTDEGLNRCMNDEEFYLSLVPSAFEKERYDALSSQIAAKDYASAFETAHALKGVLSNLALSPLSDTLGEMTELLRSDTDTDYAPLVDKMWEQFDKYYKAVNE